MFISALNHIGRNSQTYPNIKKLKLITKYSINKTFHRKFSLIRNIFQQQGFEASFETIHRPKISKHLIIGKILKFKLIKSMIDYLLLTFESQELLIKKQ
jgi:hypothetical protein